MTWRRKVLEYLRPTLATRVPPPILDLAIDVLDGEDVDPDEDRTAAEEASREAALKVGQDLLRETVAHADRVLAIVEDYRRADLALRARSRRARPVQS